MNAENVGCLGMIISLGLGLALGYGVTADNIKNYYEKEAVKHGAAEYILNPATGETKWQWKNQPKEGGYDESPKEN